MRPLYDVKGAAQVLSISPWTVRSYIRTGSIRPLRIGRRVLFQEEELERFVSEAKANGSSTNFMGKELESHE